MGKHEKKAMEWMRVLYFLSYFVVPSGAGPADIRCAELSTVLNPIRTPKAKLKDLGL